MDLKTVLLVGVVVGLIAAAILLWPDDPAHTPLIPTAKISVDNATAQWTIELKGSVVLDLEAASVSPRIQICHAATSDLISPLQPSTELGKDSKQAVPRILVEHAATTASVSIGSADVPATTAQPRILVEHAATTLPIGVLCSSSGLQSNSAKVMTKLLIEDAAVVSTTPLEAMPPDSPGR